MGNSAGRRITFTSKGVVEILPFDAGKPAKGQVLVQAVVTAISAGTELSRLYDTHMVSRPFPQNTGYLSCVRVLEAGEGVAGLDKQSLYISPMGHLSHCCIPASQLTRVPDGIAPEEAVFTGLLGVSLRSVRQAQLQLGSSMLVFGLGLIGQYAQLFARLNGATRVVGIDPSAKRRALASQTGLTHLFDPNDAGLDSALSQVTPDGRFDVVFDSTGVARVIAGLPRHVKDFGTLMILGGVHKPVELDLYTHIQKRNLRLIGSGSPDPHNFPFDTEKANQNTILDLMQARRLDIKPLITHMVPVEDAPRMYRMLQEQKDQALGVVFQWDRAA